MQHSPTLAAQLVLFQVVVVAVVVALCPSLYRTGAGVRTGPPRLRRRRARKRPVEQGGEEFGQPPRVSAHARVPEAERVRLACIHGFC